MTPNSFNPLLKPGASLVRRPASKHATMIHALERGGIDLILSDFSLAAFDGFYRRGTCAHQMGGYPSDYPVRDARGRRSDRFFQKWRDRLCAEGTPLTSGPGSKPRLAGGGNPPPNAGGETHLIEAQKIEAIGRLSSSMAHDFSNILAVIVGYNDLITAALGQDSPLRKYTEEIRQASNRAAGLTRQLLVFSRKQLVQPSIIDPNDAIQELNKLIRRVIDEKISITIVPGRQTGRVKVDSGYLIQVLLNLVFNARDAMPDGGRLAIETKELTLDQEYADAHPGTTSGRYAMLVSPIQEPG